MISINFFYALTVYSRATFIPALNDAPIQKAIANTRRTKALKYNCDLSPPRKPSLLDGANQATRTAITATITKIIAITFQTLPECIFVERFLHFLLSVKKNFFLSFLSSPFLLNSLKKNIIS